MAERTIDHGLNIDELLEQLGGMTAVELQRRYAEVFGEPTRVTHKQHLIKRIVWREQALREGDLSERARRRAAELAKDADVRLTAPTAAEHEKINPHKPGSVVTRPFDVRDPRMPLPGTVLRREYKGRAIVVRVLPSGFEFEGEVYKSLSAIATAVTGAHWNGPLFFGLAGKKVKR